MLGRNHTGRNTGDQGVAVVFVSGDEYPKSGQKVRFDAISVQAPAALMTGMSAGSLTLKDSEIATFAESIKFAVCVPKRLLARTIIARNFEPTSAQDPALTAA